MMSVSHILDHMLDQVLDHMITGLVTTELHNIKNLVTSFHHNLLSVFNLWIVEVYIDSDVQMHDQSRRIYCNK